MYKNPNNNNSKYSCLWYVHGTKNLTQQHIKTLKELKVWKSKIVFPKNVKMFQHQGIY